MPPRTRSADTDNPFWPWGARVALVTVPVLLVVIMVGLAVLREVADWPGDDHEGLVLTGAFVLILLPVILLLVGSLATGGGSVEAFGVKLAFPESQIARREVTVPPRLGLLPGDTLNDSNTVAILDTLRSAVGHQAAVVDLEDGTAWWETRLLVLCSGAARLGSPAVIVFVATVGGQRGVFQGWAPPSALLRELLAKRPDLRTVYDRQLAVHRQWELAVPPAEAEAAAPSFPLPLTPDNGMQWAVFPDGRERSRLAAEQILALGLGPVENLHKHGICTTTRLRELFDACLVTFHFDTDRSDRDIAFPHAVLSRTEPFIALTHGEVYAGLLSREEALNDVLSALVRSQ